MRVESEGDINLVYADTCAYLCSDGLSVMANSSLGFKVSNNGTQLKVSAQGLPTTSSGLSKGDLYALETDHIVRVF